jgi:hypothetical protein
MTVVAATVVSCLSSLFMFLHKLSFPEIRFLSVSPFACAACPGPVEACEKLDSCLPSS